MKRELLLQCLNKFEKLWEIGIDVQYKVELLPEIRALREELAKPVNEFKPDWDTLQPYHDRIAELEAQLALDKKADNARELGLDYEPEHEKLCVNCGKPTMHIGNKCYGCCQTAQQDHGFDRTASHMAGEYVDTNQQNVNTSEERVQKSDKSIHEVQRSGQELAQEPSVRWFDCEKFDAAPPKREWQGLTDEEIKDILDCGRGGLIDIKKTEAKLREKNET